MYQLKYKNYILYDPRLADEKLIIRDPSVKLAVSKAGEMSFTVDAEHPYLSNLRRMSGLVELLDGTFPIYRGRITSDIKDFYGAHKIETEGIMAVLNDSIIPPFNFPGDFKDDTAYKAAAASGNVVEFFFRWILSQHNAQVTAEQQIKPGVVTVSDPNNYITRSSDEYATAMTTISDKLFKSSLGGNLLIRYENDGNYLDYYAALPLTNTQTVEFAENLLDLSSETDGADIYTAILPEGKDGLTIGNLPDGDLTDDLVKSGKIIYSKSGVATYGRITRHIKWGDVTVDTNLRAKAKAALADNGLSMPETITCKAVDLGWQEGIQHFRVGRMTALVSTPHGYSASYPLMELAPDILDPGNTQITLGATRRTFTGSQIDAVRKAEESAGQVRTDLNKKIEDIELTPGPAGPAGADGKDGKDGTNGTNGLSVWITYHDGTATPATPTGNGTLNGWHTDLTAAVVWMSQKVAASATDGAWGAPIRLLGEKGEQGIQGVPGEKGDPGATGPQGERGIPGEKGDPGEQGPQGVKGDTGATGPQGEQGPQGEKGDVGPQGPQGVKGADGKTYFTWIKYADSPTSGMSDNPSGKKYIGIAYNKLTATESTNYADYSWSLIKGDKGDKGDKGATGDTGPQGEQGVKGDTGATGATGPRGPQGEKGSTGPTGNGIKSITYYYARTATQTAPAAAAITSTTMPVLDATNKYLWQKEVIAYTNGTNQTTVLLLAVYGDKGRKGDKGDKGATGETGPQGPQGDKGATGPQGEKGATGPTGPQGEKGATGPQGVSVTATTVEYYLSASETELSGGTWQSTAPAITDGKYLWGRTKITYSNGKTTYTGAYCISKAMTESAEPIVSETRTAVTKLTQDVDSFKATVSETYTEKSNFNEFRQKTESDLTANSTAIEQRYTEIKAVEQQVLGVDGKVTDVQKKVTKTAGYIRTGKVAEDESGNPIYGVKIGQTDTAGNYNAFAQFTAGRISFFDETGKEISHFAGKDFYIDSGIIVQNLNLGGYELRRNKGLGFKWIGG